MMHHHRFEVPLLVLFLALTGCDDRTSSTGYDLIPPGDIIAIDTFDSRAQGTEVRTSSYSSEIPHAGAELLSLGAASGYEAHMLLRFLPLTGIHPDSVGEGGKILSATISLTPAPYTIGDANGILSFDILETISEWSSFTLLPRTLDSIQTAPLPVGRFTGSVGDTGVVDVSIDTALARKWLVLYSQGAPADIRGVLLKPSAASTTVRAFYAFEYANGSRQPLLTVIQERFGLLDTLTSFGVVDTYTFTGPVFPTTVCEAQGSIVRRGHLWFDMRTIPPNSTINSVTVEVFLNRPASSFFYRGADSLLLQEMTDTLRRDISPYGAIGIRKSGDDIYSFTGSALTRAVQLWVNRPHANYGFAIRTTNEDSDPDIYTLFGAEADSTRRPRIRVTYTEQPLQ